MLYTQCPLTNSCLVDIFNHLPSQVNFFPEKAHTKRLAFCFLMFDSSSKYLTSDICFFIPILPICLKTQILASPLPHYTPNAGAYIKALLLFVFSFSRLHCKLLM